MSRFQENRALGILAEHSQTSELGTTLYSYDAAHQLVGERGPEGDTGTYAYDLAGNLVQAPHLSDVAIGHGNKLLTANGDRFTYDKRNNLCTWESGEQTLHFIRDSLDRLRVIEGLDRPWTAEYDPLGRRIRKTYGAESTEYFWDTDFLTAERHADGRLRIFVRIDDFSLVPRLVIDYPSEHAEPTEGRVHTILSDPRGAPIAALDSAGTRIWSASYSPYGMAKTHGDLALPQRLAGQHCDPETGLYYHRFRYYSPELGRFLEEDPAGIGGGLGLYSYTSSPLVDFDPRGLKCKECDSDDHTTEDCPETKKPTGDDVPPISSNDSSHIDKIRSDLDIGEKRNIAFAEGHVDGVDLGEVLGISGKNTPGVEAPSERIFETTVVGHDRALDSEVLILESLAHQLNPSSEGTLQLVSERTICSSCAGVISQFREKFPNINLIVRGGHGS